MVASAAVIVAAFAVLVWRGAPWLDASRLKALTPVQRETAIDAIRGRMLTLGAGLLATAARVYTALNFRLSRESHVTDRYTKAIEQLGSDKLDVRIGGIYALERVARDSARDRPTVMEVLAAFIREHSNEQWPPSDPGGQEQERSTRADVQAAVTVVGRRDAKRDIEPINLTGADLTGADLSYANLTGADRIYADLVDLGFIDADLTGADLTDATRTSPTRGGPEVRQFRRAGN